MTSRPWRTAVAASLLVLGLAAGRGAAAAEEPSPAAAAAVPAVEPRAEELLRRMSERLKTAARFAFEAEETFDELPDGEPRRQLSNLRRVAVIRPDRLAADATGDTLNRASVYDGHRLSVLDKERNTYVQVEAPPTLDAMLDMVQDKYGLTLPLADLVYADPYATLTEAVTYGRYLGIHRAAGVPCHHLVFSQPTIEWQIWIDAGADPLPRRLVITYVGEPGEPQYAATLTRWNLAPKLGDELFTFTPPAGAKRIEPRVRPAPEGAAKEARP